MIMKKTRYKRILGLFILTFVILFGGIINASAAKCTKNTKTCTSSVEKEMQDPTYWAEKYKVSIDLDDNGNYVVKCGISKDNEISGLKKDKIKFKVIALATYDLGDDGEGHEIPVPGGPGTHNIKDTKTIEAAITNKNKTLKAGGSLTIKRTGDLVDGKPGFMVALEPDGFDDPDITACCKKTFDLQVGLESYGNGTITVPPYEESISSTTTESSSQTIDCATDSDYKNNKKDTFNYKFCYVKEHADYTYDFGKLKSNNTYKAYADYISSNSKKKLPVFKCDYKSIVNSQDETVLKDDDKYYKDVNTRYIYGSGEYEKGSGTYTYRYEGRETPDTETITCNIKCEETVIVEYGPPIASEAGLCFEYRVKVTSRVSCGRTSSELKKPRTPSYCTPSPLCVHSSGTTYKQGGPNESFDFCVSKCDGGKYTDKCVTKCYNSVYKKNSKNAKTAGEFALYDTVKLANNNSKVMKAPKYEYSGDSIIWNTGQGSDDNRYGIKDSGCTSNPFRNEKTDSVWHKTNSWGSTACSGYVKYTGTGIPKTAGCTDVCTWRGCTGKDKYLNEKQAIDDYNDNKQVYEEVKKKCEAAASCSSSTTEFQISVDYTKVGSNEKTTLYFPYSTPNSEKHRDKILSKGEDNKSKTGDTYTKNNTTILNYAGCYDSESAKDWYQTEWSFPGTWLNNKTHEISYVPKNDSGWRVKPKKFCIPQNAKDVNQNWWLYYYATKKSEGSKFSVDDTSYVANTDECKDQKTSNGQTGTCNYGDFSEEDLKSPTYNIHANTQQFGYFGWNIFMDCFYALYSQFNCTNNINKSATTYSNGISCKKTNIETDYRVRPVDLKNLFPGNDGKEVAYDKTGRTPGYNWSKYANQTLKDINYKSTPEKYTKWVQQTGYNVYADEYLDYYIKLSKADIAKIKKSNVDYTKSNGETEVDSVINYKSNLIRGNSLTISKYPNSKALKCNNIGKHSLPANGEYSASCQEFE